MTPLEQVKKLAELQATSTPGPWQNEFSTVLTEAKTHAVINRWEKGKPVVSHYEPESIAHLNDGEYIENPKSSEDAAFIAAAGSFDFAALHALLTPTPAASATGGAEEAALWLPGDKAVVAAVTEAAEGHEGVYLSSKAAKRLLRLIADLARATPTPAPGTGAAGAVPEAATAAWISVAERLPEMLADEFTYGSSLGDDDYDAEDAEHRRQSALVQICYQRYADTPNDLCVTTGRYWEVCGWMNDDGDIKHVVSWQPLAKPLPAAAEAGPNAE